MRSLPAVAVRLSGWLRACLPVLFWEARWVYRSRTFVIAACKCRAGCPVKIRGCRIS